MKNLKFSESNKMKQKNKKIDNVQKPTIELKDDKKSEKKKTQKSKTKKRRFVKTLLRILAVVAIFFLGVGIAGYIYLLKPAIDLKNHAENAIYNLKELKKEFYAGDLTKYETRMDSIDEDLEELEKGIDYFKFAGNHKQTEGYWNNAVVARDMIGTSRDLLEKSRPRMKTIMEELLVNYDPDAIKEEKQAELESEDDKKLENDETEQEDINANICRDEDDIEEDEIYQILQDTESEKNSDLFEGVESRRPFSLQDVVATLPEVSLLYDEIESDLFKLTEDLDRIDPDYIPDLEYGDFGNIKEQFEEAKKLGDEFEKISPKIKETLAKLPELLGSEEPVTYLLVLQNEKELRATGGLFTAYGTFTVDKGEIVGDIETYDMWILENYTYITLRDAPKYYNKYGQLDLMLRGCGEYHLRAQDSSIYPDNYVSVDIFKDYYDKAREYDPEEYPGYDHVVTFNTFFASDLIKAVEPLVLKDEEVMCAKDSAKKIFSHTSVHYDNFKTRKSYIGLVGDALQEKLFSLSGKEFLKIAQVGIRSTQAKNLSLYSKDEEMQQYFDDLGLTARTVMNFDGDYLHFNEAQNCALKANFYIYDTVDMNIKINENGSVSKNLDIEWVNEKVYDHDERHILSNWPNYRYRAWIRFFGPKGTEYDRAKKRGMNEPFLTQQYKVYKYYDKLAQKNIYDDVIWFDHRRPTEKHPIKKASMHVKIHSPENIKYTEEDGYKLLLQSHPGKKNELYRIKLEYNGETYENEVKLNRDKVINFKDGELKVEDYKHELDDIYDLIDIVRGVKYEESDRSESTKQHEEEIQ